MASFQLYQDPLVSCPYNPAHRLKKSRMQIHLVKCKKDHEDKELKICPYNAQHRIQGSEYQYHISTCPDSFLIERQIGYESDLHQGNTTVPPYNKPEPVFDGEYWDETPSTQPGYVPIKKEIKGKPADRRKHYKSLFAAVEECNLNGANAASPSPDRSQSSPSHAKAVVSPTEVKPLRKPKTTPEALLMQNGFGRGALPATRRKIAANIFGGPTASPPPGSLGLGRGLSIGLGLGRGLGARRLEPLNHPPLAPGQIQYLDEQD